MKVNGMAWHDRLSVLMRLCSILQQSMRGGWTNKHAGFDRWSIALSEQQTRRQSAQYRAVPHRDRQSQMPVPD
jgi:hypothetical protein